MTNGLALMTNGFYEKTPSLSLRLRVPQTGRAERTNSNNLEWHSSLFELIRVSVRTAMPPMSNKLECYRISSNNLEQRTVAYG
jgi:hypothetical protein